MHWWREPDNMELTFNAYAEANDEHKAVKSCLVTPPKCLSGKWFATDGAEAALGADKLDDFNYEQGRPGVPIVFHSPWNPFCLDPADNRSVHTIIMG